MRCMRPVSLDELKRNGSLWRGRRNTLAGEKTLASGWRVLDKLLGGGWPRAALAEVLSDAHQGLSLLLPVIAELSTDKRWTVDSLVNTFPATLGDGMVNPAPPKKK